MKKSIFLLIGYFLFVNYSRGQQSSFGVTAGAVFSSYKVKAESVSVTSKIKPGFTVGITSAIGIGQYFSFMPGLNFVQKGGKFKSEGTEDKINLNYLEVPLNFVYNLTSPSGSFFVGAGPSLSFGLSGKDKWKDGTESGENKVNFGSDVNDDMKPFEAGINFLAGYRFKGGFLVSGNYNAGINNIANNDPAEPIKAKLHHNYFGIRFGYMFASKVKEHSKVN